MDSFPTGLCARMHVRIWAPRAHRVEEKNRKMSGAISKCWVSFGLAQDGQDQVEEFRKTRDAEKKEKKGWSLLECGPSTSVVQRQGNHMPYYYRAIGNDFNCQPNNQLSLSLPLSLLARYLLRIHGPHVHV